MTLHTIFCALVSPLGVQGEADAADTSESGEMETRGGAGAPSTLTTGFSGKLIIVVFSTNLLTHDGVITFCTLCAACRHGGDRTLDVWVPGKSSLADETKFCDLIPVTT